MGKTLDFIFNLDVFMSNGFGQKISQATQTLTTLQQKTQELQRVSGKIDGYRAQEHAIAQTSGKLSGLRESLSRTQAAAQTSRQTTQLLSEQYKQAQARVQDLSGKYPRQSIVMKLARQEAARLKDAYTQSEGMTRKLSSEESRLSSQVKKVEESLSGENSKLQALQSGLREAGIDTQNCEGGFFVLKQDYSMKAKYTAITTITMNAITSAQYPHNFFAFLTFEVFSLMLFINFWDA